MDMELNITIVKIETKVRLAQDRRDNIKAFGELWFYETDPNLPLIKVKGFTIKLLQLQSGKEVLSVAFPAFGSPRSKTGFQTSFIIENRSLLDDVRKLFLDEFSQLTDGLSPIEFGRIDNKYEGIDLDEIDAGLEKMKLEEKTQTKL